MGKKKFKFEPQVFDLQAGIDFKESQLIKISIAENMGMISLVLSVPDHQSDEWGSLYYSIVLDRVLKFSFETKWDGEKHFYPTPIEDIKVVQDEEWQQWRSDIEEVMKNRSKSNPNYALPQLPPEVTKIVFFNQLFRSFNKDGEPVGGFVVICRDVSIENLGHQWTDR